MSCAHRCSPTSAGANVGHRHDAQPALSSSSLPQVARDEGSLPLASVPVAASLLRWPLFLLWPRFCGGLASCCGLGSCGGLASGGWPVPPAVASALAVASRLWLCSGVALLRAGLCSGAGLTCGAGRSCGAGCILRTGRYLWGPDVPVERGVPPELALPAAPAAPAALAALLSRCCLLHRPFLLSRLDGGLGLLALLHREPELVDAAPREAAWQLRPSAAGRGLRQQTGRGLCWPQSCFAAERLTAPGAAAAERPIPARLGGRFTPPRPPL